MKFRSLMACLLFVAASMKGHGQDSTGLSLPQLWEHAFANYPSLDIYRSQKRQADIDKKLTRNQYLPDVHLQAQNTFGTQNAVSGAFFPLPGLYNVNGSGLDNASDHAANTFGSVAIDWKFLQFGKQKISEQAAEIFTNQAAHRIDVERLYIQAELSRLYFQLFFHQRMEDWAQDNSGRLRNIFEASTSKARAGLSAGADTLLIGATLAQTNADLHVWQGRQEETKIALARWVDISANQLAIKDPPFFSDVNPHVIPETRNSEQLHPRLAFKKEQIVYAEKQKELAQASALPSLSLLGGFQVRGNAIEAEGSLYENWRRSYNSPVHNYAVGFGLTWNIGNAFDSRLERRRYEEAVRQREAETEEVALGLRSLEEIAQRQMTQSRRQIANADKAFESASQAYALFQARYNSGLISITELLQIQDVLQGAERTCIEAYYQYWIQHVNLAESTADFSYLQKIFE